MIIGDIVRHHKYRFLTEEEKKTNKYIYKILNIAKHTETEEDMVVYQALYPPFKVWVRPLSMFNEVVGIDESGVPIPRFEKVEYE